MTQEMIKYPKFTSLTTIDINDNLDELGNHGTIGITHWRITSPPPHSFCKGDRAGVTSPGSTKNRSDRLRFTLN